MTSQITWRQTITIYCWKVQADHRICSAKNLLTTKQDHKSEEDHSEDNFLAPTFENKAESPPTTLSLLMKVTALLEHQRSVKNISKT